MSPRRPPVRDYIPPKTGDQIGLVQPMGANAFFRPVGTVLRSRRATKRSTPQVGDQVQLLRPLGTGFEVAPAGSVLTITKFDGAWYTAKDAQGNEWLLTSDDFGERLGDDFLATGGVAMVLSAKKQRGTLAQDGVTLLPDVGDTFYPKETISVAGIILPKAKPLTTTQSDHQMGLYTAVDGDGNEFEFSASDFGQGAGALFQLFGETKRPLILSGGQQRTVDFDYYQLTRPAQVSKDQDQVMPYNPDDPFGYTFNPDTVNLQAGDVIEITELRPDGRIGAMAPDGTPIEVELDWLNANTTPAETRSVTLKRSQIRPGSQVQLPGGQQGTVLEVRGGKALVEVKATPVKRALADAYQMTKQAFATLQVPNGSQTELLLYAGDVIDTATEEVLPDGTVTFYAPDGDVIQVSMSWVNANAMPLGGSTSQSQPVTVSRIGSSIIVPRDNTILYFADISSAINGMGERGYIPAGETGRVIDYQADAYIVQMDNGQYGYTALSDMTMDAGFANWL